MVVDTPVLRKSSLAELQAANPPDGGLFDIGAARALYYSPGGVLEPHLPEAAFRLAALLAQAGFRAGDRVLNGFSYHFTPAGLLFHEALVHVGCTVLPTGPQNLDLQVEFGRRARATAFVGIASHLRLLLDAPGGEALNIRIAMAGAEPLANAIRADLLARHGVACCDMYGFAEAGIIARGVGDQGVLELHSDVVVEVLDPVTLEPLPHGSAGELVVSLDDPVFPLMRFATGDLVRLVVDTAAAQIQTTLGLDASPAPRFMVLLGRTGNSVRVKGMLLHAPQLKDFAQRCAVAACALAVSRDAAGQDVIAVRVKPHGAVRASDTDMNAAFVTACRMRASSIKFDESLEDGAFTITDERNANSAR